MSVILASASPRRRELLELIGVIPQIMPPEVDESWRSGETVEKFLQRVTVSKALNIYQTRFRNHLIIAADTIVVIDETIIGKPRDTEDARNMLSKLSERRHQVWTGLALLYKGETHFKTAITDVYFKKLSAGEILHYLEREDFLDKAGAYAIQGRASVFVERIDGCYFNVMGFPLNLFYTMTQKMGFSLPD